LKVYFLVSSFKFLLLRSVRELHRRRDFRCRRVNDPEFFAIIVAGTQANGFVTHWKNLVPAGLPWPIYIMLIPIEILGMFVRPFALTMRLAANMAGGHIAILALLSLIFVFTSLFERTIAGIGIGMVLSLPIGVGLTALELIVILVQAYVFTLLTAVFIGMAIHAHH